jgi:hypothetical protein
MRDAAILDYTPAVGTHAALKKEEPSARPARGSSTRLHCLPVGAKGKDHQFRRIGMVLDHAFGLFAAVQKSVRGPSRHVALRSPSVAIGALRTWTDLHAAAGL